MAAIVLLTDFGYADGFSGTMKGVIASINPEVQILDLSHGISPQNTRHAAFVLWQAYRFFPERSLFVCVVDPGVGSKRRIILVRTEKYDFLAPENGVLDLVLGAETVLEAVELQNDAYFLDPVSRTFHGRDIFAPVAAHVSLGRAISEFGPPVSISGMERPFVEVNGQGRFIGKIIYVDHFGNLTTNLLLKYGLSGRVEIGGEPIPGFSLTFSDVGEGKLLAYRGSSGLLEIALRNGNAKEALNKGEGVNVVLEITTGA